MLAYRWKVKRMGFSRKNRCRRCCSRRSRVGNLLLPSLSMLASTITGSRGQLFSISMCVGIRAAWPTSNLDLEYFWLRMLSVLNHAACSVCHFLLFEKLMANPRSENLGTRDPKGPWKPVNRKKSRTHGRLSLFVVLTLVKSSMAL
jgi:hypothetical protein